MKMSLRKIQERLSAGVDMEHEHISATSLFDDEEKHVSSKGWLIKKEESKAAPADYLNAKITPVHS